MTTISQTCLKSFPVGKLPQGSLDALLRQLPQVDPRVLVGPRTGEDAAVIDFGDTLLVAKADPITFATEDIGWYAVNVNANDIATMGATPRWFLPVLLLPQHSTNQELVESIFHQVREACEQLGISVVGGHTEITYGLDRPILSGQMLGEVRRERLITTGGAKPGDNLIITKGIAIEGTAVLAIEKGKDAVRKSASEDLVNDAKIFLRNPGISVVREAQLASGAGGVHSMHDPTEGGIATGLREVAAAAEVGLNIEGDAIPVFRETQALCRAFGLNPFGLLASGCLVLTCANEATDGLLRAFREAGVQGSIVGKVTDRSEGLVWKIAGVTRPFPEFPADELAKVFIEDDTVDG
ncbi:MAG: hydrogenase expression protein [Armatimonadetes bacterium]|nr:hydrogenase expression protein [Armatimonadota bacterium]